jgi:hypothetical protein
MILPQAARISIPPTVGFAVQLIKNTSIAAIIEFAVSGSLFKEISPVAHFCRRQRVLSQRVLQDRDSR